MEYPQYYSTQAAPTASSTAGIIADRFPFVASQIIVTNQNAVNFWVNLKSTATASTADLCVRSCNSIQLTGFLCGGFAAYTTSTGATSLPLNVTAYASV